jgi:3'-5' exoribonuclease
VGKFYPHVNLDLLMTGTIFHDIGKIEEFEYAKKFDYSTSGRLMGHIFLGTRIVDRLIDGLADFPEGKRRLLMHMILSHHGEVERSPIVPMTLEACLLHHVENMDAQMMAFEREMEKAREENLGWTNYVKLIDRYLYLGETEADEDNTVIPEKKGKGKTDSASKKKAEKSDFSEPSLF